MSELLGLVLLGIYAVGAFKFWNGFNRTNFTTGKLYLTLLWPAFLVGNKTYRKNFNKAIKGS